MILPRFSIRTALIGLTVAAVFFLVVGDAVRGKAWAVGVTVAITSVLVTILCHAMFYGLSMALMRLLGREALAVRTSQGALRSKPQEPSNTGQDAE